MFAQLLKLLCKLRELVCMGGIVADHVLHQRHQLLLGVRASRASGAGVLVAAMVMGVRMVMVMRMGVLVGMRAPVSMGMLVGVFMGMLVGVLVGVRVIFMLMEMSMMLMARAFMIVLLFM